MRFQRILLGFAVLCLFATPALAEQVIEAWRSPFGVARSVSVNPTDGSCWIAAGSSLIHVASDCTILREITGPTAPVSVSVNPTDGSCWVADESSLLHLAEDGAELWRGKSSVAPVSVSVNPTDGSCWVADQTGEVIRVAEGGSELWRGDDFVAPSGVSVNPTDGSCWVSDSSADQVIHLAEDGTELWRGDNFSEAASVSVNPTDGSCWVAARGYHDFWWPVQSGQVGQAVVHLAADGTELWRAGGGPIPVSVSADPTDGSCWVVYQGWDSCSAGDCTWVSPAVAHLAEDGTELWREGGLLLPQSVSVNPADGSCWIADTGNKWVLHRAHDGSPLGAIADLSPEWPQIGVVAVSVNPRDGSTWVVTRSQELFHLAANGSVLWRGGGFYQAMDVSVNPTDGSCWVAGGFGSTVWHFAEDGTELWRGAGFDSPWSVSANPTDGSCWVADANDHHVIHLAEDGTELWRGYEWPFAPLDVSVNPTDGSCWVADAGDDSVVHLAEDGTELWRGGGYPNVTFLSVNPTDGSCWVGGGPIVHLAEDGTELSRGGSGMAVSVNPTDGSCWVADWANEQVIHLAEDGTELWRGGDFKWLRDVAVDPTDGSCWVGDWDRAWHFVISLSFGDVPYYHWARLHIEACVQAGIVSGYGDGTYQPGNPVTRDQMAVFIARALAGGDENVPDGPDTATFNDVPTDFWAYKYVEYCVITGVVQGFDPVTYGPTVTVSRDAMAAFIARAVAGDDDSVPDGPAEATFDDVPTDHWAYKYVEHCAAEGIVHGYDSVTYGPTGTVSRDQMAVFISRAFQLL